MPGTIQILLVQPHMLAVLFRTHKFKLSWARIRRKLGPGAVQLFVQNCSQKTAQLTLIDTRFFRFSGKLFRNS
jgi:hypothetical protein